MRGISWLAERTLSFSRRTLLHGVSYLVNGYFTHAIGSTFPHLQLASSDFILTSDNTLKHLIRLLHWQNAPQNTWSTSAFFRKNDVEGFLIFHWSYTVPFQYCERVTCCGNSLKPEIRLTAWIAFKRWKVKSRTWGQLDHILWGAGWLRRKITFTFYHSAFNYHWQGTGTSQWLNRDQATGWTTGDRFPAEAESSLSPRLWSPASLLYKGHRE
jgi:hypothetical protein